MTGRLVVVALAALLLAGPTPEAHGLVLCAARTGRVAARPACRRQERLLDRAALGLVGSEAQGAPGAGVRIRTVDGEFFGSNAVGGIQAGTSVLVPVGPLIVSVQIDGLVRPSGAYFVYEQSGCQGQRYLGSEPNLFVRPATSTNPPYYAGDPIGSHTDLSNEFTDYAPTLCALQSGTVLGTSCCFAGSGMTNDFLAPAMPIDVTSVAVPLQVVVSP